jgi:hypothetical protein
MDEAGDVTATHSHQRRELFVGIPRDGQEPARTNHSLRIEGTIGKQRGPNLNPNAPWQVTRIQFVVIYSDATADFVEASISGVDGESNQQAYRATQSTNPPSRNFRIDPC